MKTFVLFLLVSFFALHSSNAQLSSYSFQSASGSFTAITGGTVLGSTSNDEQVFNNNTTGEAAPQTDIGFPIGFNFIYNGSVFDRFAVNTNGWILLGAGTFSIAGTTTPISNTSTAGFANILSIMGRDLQGQTGSELSYKLIGSSPTRTLVVQWLNYRRYNVTGENFNFQIRLNEADYTINFVYGTVTTTNTSTTIANNPTQLGIRGATNADYINRTTSTSWSASTAGTLNTNTMRLTTTVGPASGLTYTWVPANMTYTSSTTLQADTTNVTKNSANNQVIKIQVVVSGTSNPISATSFTLNTTGTTVVSDIKNAKVWYTGTSAAFAPTTQFGSTVLNPSGSYVVTGTQPLVSGTNYFWLTYDVPLTAVTNNKIDGGCSSITVVTAKTPTVTAPAGSRTISPSPLTGNYNVGLSLFNRVIGKDLYFKKVTSKVLADKFIQNDKPKTKKAPDVQTKIAGDYTRVSSEIDRDSFVLMDGDLPYAGSQRIDVTPDMRTIFGKGVLPDNVNGIYSNITTAVNDLNVSGMQGPVVFYLVDALYSSETFPIIVNNISGSSAVNTFTLKPAAGISPQIVMTTGAAMLKIYSSSYVTIDGSNTANGTTRDLTLTDNYGNTSFCIWIGSAGTTVENNIIVENCSLKSGENSFGSSPVLVSDGDVSGNPGYFNNVTIQNNIFKKGRQAIYVNGGIVPQNISNVNILNNVINSTGGDATGFMGIYLQGVNSADIKGNEIANLDSTDDENDVGVWVAFGSQSVIVESNKIYNIGYTGSSGNGAYGILLTPNQLNSAVEVRNNLIYNIYGTGWSYTDGIYFLDNPAGIALYSFGTQSGISLYNNSINLYGNTLNQTLALSSGIFVSTGSTVDIRNNIIKNNLGLSASIGYGSCAIYLQNSIAQLLNTDYNNYFVNPTGSGVKLLGKISTSLTSTDIVSWKTITGKDKSSLNFDPGFISNTNLQPDVNNQSSWSLIGRGTQISTVNSDYQSNPRSITLPGGGPDIGAYEFSPTLQPITGSQVGIITNGGTTKYIFGGDTVASIVWHGASLPASVIVKYYSGSNPPATTSGNYGNCYWTFTPIGGSAYTFDITLYYDPSLIGAISGESNISIANYTAGAWTHSDAVVNTTLRTATHNGLSSLTTFTIDDKTGPLPVNIEYFKAITSSRDVNLTWATESEINNSGFEIERKSDAENLWTGLGFVKGNGTISHENVYSFKDTRLNEGKYNYRLKQIDFNNHFDYYDLNGEVLIGTPVSFGMSQSYPNPSNPNSKIDYQLPFDGQVSIKIYDVQGREVATIINGFSKAGYHSAEFDGSNLASGVYFYRINSANFTQTMKLVLVK